VVFAYQCHPTAQNKKKLAAHMRELGGRKYASAAMIQHFSHEPEETEGEVARLTDAALAEQVNEMNVDEESEPRKVELQRAAMLRNIVADRSRPGLEQMRSARKLRTMT
jgi:hypothetical protein